MSSINRHAITLDAIQMCNHPPGGKFDGAIDAGKRGSRPSRANDFSLSQLTVGFLKKLPTLGVMIDRAGASV